MDFAPPAAVRRALTELVRDGDLGYPPWLLDEGTPLRAAFAARMARRHRWTLDPGEVREFSCVVQALQAVLHVSTGAGDPVAVHVPAYPPVLGSVTELGRRLVPLPLAAGAPLDVDRLADTVARERVRVLVLVNPHNPTGRCLDRAELAAVAAVAETHDLLVVADEIHAELTHRPHAFVPFASLSAATAARTVTLTAASKAFNLAGLRCAVAHLGPARVRADLGRLPPDLLGEVGAPAVVATLAAWRHGDAWLDAVLRVLAANRTRLAERLPGLGIGYDVPQAGYLAWLDCRALDLPGDPADFFLRTARVRLSSGRSFGPGGEGFARLAFGTDAATVEEMCDRLAAALGR
jgi:cystathionine beta-lyase